ncbi:hypothetical protein GB937_009384, partial [Aspergillus fischeri]
MQSGENQINQPTLNATLYGRLIAHVLLGSICHNVPFNIYDPDLFAELQDTWNKTKLSYGHHGRKKSGGDPEQNYDLHWALSGSGLGTSTVVLSMTAQLHADGIIGGATLTFDDNKVANDEFCD